MAVKSETFMSFVFVVSRLFPVCTKRTVCRMMIPRALKIILSSLRGADLFAAGVMRSTVKQNNHSRSATTAVYWAVDKLLRGAKTYAGRAVLIGTGVMASRNDGAVAVKMMRTAGPPLPPLHNPEWGVLQNLPSCVIGHCFKQKFSKKANDGVVVLDMCAAPGNKSIIAACLLCGDESKEIEFELCRIM